MSTHVAPLLYNFKNYSRLENFVINSKIIPILVRCTISYDEEIRHFAYRSVSPLPRPEEHRLLAFFP
jgi:hypothetical protein